MWKRVRLWRMCAQRTYFGMSPFSNPRHICVFDMFISMRCIPQREKNQGVLNALLHHPYQKRCWEKSRYYPCYVQHTKPEPVNFPSFWMTPRARGGLGHVVVWSSVKLLWRNQAPNLTWLGALLTLRLSPRCHWRFWRGWKINQRITLPYLE